MRRAALALVAVGALASAARGEPRPMADAARAHFDSGLRAYRARAWSQAIDELRAGYAIDPHPDFLFPWAQATRLSGDCAGALPLYRRALDAAASEVDRRDIQVLITRCEREVTRTRDQPPEPEPDAAPEPAPQPSPRATRPPAARASVAVEAGSPPPRPPPWYTDTLGGGLAIGGALGLVAGAGFLIAASRAETDASSASSLDDFVTATDRADQRRLIGAVALGAGAGLAAVAALRYAWVAHRSARDVSVVLAPTPRGAALSLATSF